MNVDCLRTSGRLNDVHLKLTTSVAGKRAPKLWNRFQFKNSVIKIYYF